MSEEASKDKTDADVRLESEHVRLPANAQYSQTYQTSIYYTLRRLGELMDKAYI